MENERKCYVVTGTAGFLGSHLTEALLAKGHSVLGWDNFETGLEENMSSFRNHKDFTFINKDFSDVDEVNDMIAMLGFKKIKIDGMFMVGARARIQPSISNPSRTFACNVIGTFNLLEFCRALDIKNVVYSGSSSMYGAGTLPNKPDDKDECLNPYSSTKLLGEKLCKTWHKCYGINCVVLRYFNIYGPRSQLSGGYAPVIGNFFMQRLREKKPMTIVGTGEQRRDLTYVADVVDANILAMENCERVTGKTFNVGTGKNYSVNQIAELIGGQTTFIPPRPAELEATLADITETTAELGWIPKVSLEEGIELARKHYTELFKNEQ